MFLSYIWLWDCSSAGLEHHPAEVRVARSNRVSLKPEKTRQVDEFFLFNTKHTIRTEVNGTKKASGQAAHAFKIIISTSLSEVLQGQNFTTPWRASLVNESAAEGTNTTFVTVAANRVSLNPWKSSFVRMSFNFF